MFFSNDLPVSLLHEETSETCIELQEKERKSATLFETQMFVDGEQHFHVPLKQPRSHQSTTTYDQCFITVKKYLELV